MVTVHTMNSIGMNGFPNQWLVGPFINWNFWSPYRGQNTASVFRRVINRRVAMNGAYSQEL